MSVYSCRNTAVTKTPTLYGWYELNNNKKNPLIKKPYMLLGFLFILFTSDNEISVTPITVTVSLFRKPFPIPANI